MEPSAVFRKYKPQLAVLLCFAVVFSALSFVAKSSSFANARALINGGVAEGSFIPILGSSEKLALRLEGKDVPLSLVDKYHVVLMYDDLKVTSLCTVESLLRALLRGPSTHLNYASHHHVVAKDPHLFPLVVFVWVNDLGQQSKAFAELRQILSEQESKRKVYLIQKEINFEEAVAGTAFESFYKEKSAEDLGRYGDQNKGNALRLAIVQKYGGMYLDADMLVVNDPSRLSDGIARQNAETFNNAAFKFHDPQNSFVKRLTRNFVRNYMGDRWGKQGPQLFSRVVNAACESKESKFVCTLGGNSGEGGTDEGGEVVEFSNWGVKRFYPLPWYAGDKLDRDYHAIINQFKINMASERTTIMLHLWHRASKVGEKRLCQLGNAAYKRSFIGHVKSEHCPMITKRTLQIPAKGKRSCDKF